MQITITTAGRNALVNAENNGTAPVEVVEIGVTDQVFVPDAGMTALPGEIKRLSTFAGQAVADDTVHVTIRDESEDVYTLRGFGLYLEDGTLFAVYGQSDPILEKSEQAMLLLSADVQFTAINATSLTFGATNFLNPPATTEVQGVVELATNTEASDGTDSQRAVTPAGVKAALDNRLGAGAPSDFIKSMLKEATAAAVRALLAIKSAALRDEEYFARLTENNVFSGPNAFSRASNAIFYTIRPDAPANQKRWRWQVTGSGAMSLAAENDKGATESGSAGLTISRSEANVAGIAIGNTASNPSITLNGVSYTDFARLSQPNTFAGLQTLTGGGERLRIIENDTNGFIAFFNQAGTVRQGYISSSNSANTLAMEAEDGSSLRLRSGNSVILDSPNIILQGNVTNNGNPLATVVTQEVACFARLSPADLIGPSEDVNITVKLARTGYVVTVVIPEFQFAGIGEPGLAIQIFNALPEGFRPPTAQRVPFTPVYVNDGATLERYPAYLEVFPSGALILRPQEFTFPTQDAWPAGQIGVMTGTVTFPLQ